MPYIPPKFLLLSKDAGSYMRSLKGAESQATYKFYFILILIVVPLISFMSAVAVWLIKKWPANYFIMT